MADLVIPEEKALAHLLKNPESVCVDGKWVSVDEALGDAEYLALCFSASYCPSCRLFMPSVDFAYNHADLQKKCKVLLVGGDKTKENFEAYRDKYPHFLSLSFEETLSLKEDLRDKWKIQTIPHVVLLDRAAKLVQGNIRMQIENNPQCHGFPWIGVRVTPGVSTAGINADPEKHWTLTQRIVKTPRFWQLGHLAKEASPQSMYMDEHAVRARAGLLNITSWMALINIFFLKEKLALWILWPIVGWDMLSAALFGLTPLSPYGMLATLLAYLFGPAEPLWKPAAPKRFAWMIGFALVNTCGIAGVFNSREAMIVAAVMCNVATWAECALGFCAGCWMWNTIIAPRLGQKPCQECKL
mmetsp:Transcript_146936/g.208320  ORF Transcript_146936/g.208320 Transcript_146936/m.208320 type:complete len:356 (+) Transcript_146936:56-1123(+)|eukprot:symbB.v1.2.027750.t1/scaffold2871.1/size68436/2